MLNLDTKFMLVLFTTFMFGLDIVNVFGNAFESEKMVLITFG